MKRYSYKALTPSGDVIAGMLDAESDIDGRKQIEARGMIPIEITKSGINDGGLDLNWRSWFTPSASEKDVTDFLQQLAILLQASVRLDHALELLAHKELAGAMAEPVRDIRRAILSGESLSRALSRHRNLFPDSMDALVALAEQSGTLPNAIAAIATERERTAKLKQKALDALTYPAFLLMAVAGVLFFFITFVLPQFRPIIADTGSKADPVLLTLLDLSAFFELHRTEALFVLIAALIGLVLFFRSPTRRLGVLNLVLKTPGLRVIARDYRTARFCRNFGHLAERGIALVDAIELTGKTITAFDSQIRFAEARDAVRQGQSVFDALEKTGLLAPVALRMLRIGEETGRIPAIAIKAAELFEARVERQLEKLVGLIGPIAIMIVSLIVGGLIVSVMTALMSINQLVS